MKKYEFIIFAKHENVFETIWAVNDQQWRFRGLLPLCEFLIPLVVYTVPTPVPTCPPREEKTSSAYAAFNNLLRQLESTQNHDKSRSHFLLFNEKHY